MQSCTDLTSIGNLLYPDRKAARLHLLLMGIGLVSLDSPAQYYITSRIEMFVAEILLAHDRSIT